MMQPFHTSTKNKLLALGFLLLFTACKKQTDFKDVVLITGAESTNIISFPVDGAQSAIALTATATTLVNQDIEVGFQVDTSLLKAYNEDNETNFYVLPQGSYTLSAPTAVIQSGGNVSNAVKITITSIDSLVQGRNYLLPVTIQVKKGNLQVLKSSGTAFLKIQQVIHTLAADFGTRRGPYTNTYLKDTMVLNAFTLEYRLNANQFGALFHINTLFAFDGSDRTGNSSSFNLLRFGELSDAINQLQWINNAGKVSSKTLFAINTWYHIAAVYDGRSCSLYINGQLDASFPAAGFNFYLNRFQISSDGQPFVGKLSELRLWSRALSPGELRNGFCAVDPASTGLLCYWKMNEGQGQVLTDYSGHGHNIQASNAYSWANNIRCPE